MGRGPTLAGLLRMWPGTVIDGRAPFACVASPLPPTLCGRELPPATALDMPAPACVCVSCVGCVGRVGCLGIPGMVIPGRAAGLKGPMFEVAMFEVACVRCRVSVGGRVGAGLGTSCLGTECEAAIAGRTFGGGALAGGGFVGWSFWPWGATEESGRFFLGTAKLFSASFGLTFSIHRNNSVKSPIKSNSFAARGRELAELRLR